MQRQIAELGSQSLISKNKDLLDTTRAAQETGALLSEEIEHLLSNALDPFSLIYWEDEMGKHSYYTSDVVIK